MTYTMFDIRWFWQNTNLPMPFVILHNWWGRPPSILSRARLQKQTGLAWWHFTRRPSRSNNMSFEMLPCSRNGCWGWFEDAATPCVAGLNSEGFLNKISMSPFTVTDGAIVMVQQSFLKIIDISSSWDLGLGTFGGVQSSVKCQVSSIKYLWRTQLNTCNVCSAVHGHPNPNVK